MSFKRDIHGIGNFEAVVKTDKPIREVIPALIFKFPPGVVNYSKSDGTLTTRVRRKLVAFYPSGEIAISPVKGKSELMEFSERILKIINEAYEELKRNGPPTEKELKALKKLSPLTLYKYLPKTNCRECGEPTCFAFATKVITGEAKISLCKPLNTDKYRVNIKKLKKDFGERIANSLGCF